MRRLRPASKAPVAIGGILALPLFFIGLMAFSLKLDEPSHHLTKKATIALGDPTKGTIGTVYLLALAVSVGVVLVGVVASPLGSRLAGVDASPRGHPRVRSASASARHLGGGAHEAVPPGVDNIPQSSPQDLFLRGEWEGTARTTAHQIGLVTIGLALAAIVLSVALEIRRRRGIDGPAVPPPPAVSGLPETSPAVELELADSDLVRGR